MRNKLYSKHIKGILVASMILTGALTGCTASSANTESTATGVVVTAAATADAASDTTTSEDTTTTTSSTSIDTTDLFTDRDLEQEADLTDAKAITVTSGEDVSITEEGIYVLSGTATDVTITVEAAEDAKVQLVLDGVSITNTDAPAIYVKTADKVFVTTTDSENTLAVTGTFVADGDTNLDAVIFSKSDLVLNGVGTMAVTCTEGNGITSKDDLKVTGGTYTINAAADGIEANDSISICDGTITIESQKDAIHCENEEDLTLGSIYISGGTFNLTATDDGIQGTSIVQIDGGTINVASAAEGIEGTYVIINDGTITINATDDGINATSKSTAYDVVIEFNGGSTTVSMGQGDVDAIDANGSIYVNDGTITITSSNGSFDYDATAEFNGGTIIVNGEEVTEIPTSMMGGGGQRGGGMRQ